MEGGEGTGSGKKRGGSREGPSKGVVKSPKAMLPTANDDGSDDEPQSKVSVVLCGAERPPNPIPKTCPCTTCSAPPLTHRAHSHTNTSHTRASARTHTCTHSHTPMHTHTAIQRRKEAGPSTKSKNRRCSHDIELSTCKRCGGNSICVHGRRRTRCKDCGGGSICEHNTQRSNCKVCSPARFSAPCFCIHGKWRYSCRECTPASFCTPHGKRQCEKCLLQLFHLPA